MNPGVIASTFIPERMEKSQNAVLPASLAAPTSTRSIRVEITLTSAIRFNYASLRTWLHHSDNINSRIAKLKHSYSIASLSVMCDGSMMPCDDIGNVG